MTEFEFELTYKVELTRTVLVVAATEEQAQQMVDDCVAARAGFGLDRIKIQCPDEWDVSHEEIDTDVLSD